VSQFHYQRNSGWQTTLACARLPFFKLAVIAAVSAFSLGWSTAAGAADRAEGAKAVKSAGPEARQATGSTATKNAVSLDPSVIDPVGKLAEISASVSQSSNELTAISQDLDKLTNELSRVEKDHTAKVTKASLDALQKRFKETIARSYDVEKRVKDSLTKSQADIENVRLALTSIQSERAGGAARRPVMTDDEINECLKDLNDLSATIKSLQLSLSEDDSKDADSDGKKATKKTPKIKTAGSLPRGHIVKDKKVKISR
jgi:cob(I)alamin adenosyltransferase